MKKRYLGDSVYVEYDGFHLVLTTENGYGPSNTIMLDSEVFSELKKFSEQLRTGEVEA